MKRAVTKNLRGVSKILVTARKAVVYFLNTKSESKRTIE